METHAALFRYLDGRTVQLGIARNVAERKKEEGASLLLSAIVDSSDDGIISKDLEGIITRERRAAVRLYRRRGGRPARRDSPHSRRSPGRRAEDPGPAQAWGARRSFRDCALLDISLTISPVKDREDRVVGASKIARDISDRKRVEKVIEALNAQLATDLGAITRMQQLSTRSMQVEDFAGVSP
jgi:PAS domain-containing protein